MSAALAGKVALVTGAARGIGRATALKLARAGCDVAANYYNSAEQAEALCDEIRALGRRAIAIQGSVGVPDSVDEIFAEFRKHFDRLDILVSNAASGVLKPTVEMTLKHFRWCMETNALALNLLVQRALPLVTDGARVVALSSLGAQRAMPGYGFIGASKAALESLAPRKINVNCVAPGVIETEMSQEVREASGADVKSRILLRRYGQPAEVAYAVWFLASSYADYVTGQVWSIDGGFKME